MIASRIYAVCCLIVCQVLSVVNCETPTCQVEGLYEGLSLEDFKKTTCALCYLYITSSDWTRYRNTSLSYDYKQNVLIDHQNNTHDANPDDATGLVYSSFQYDYTRKQWQQCCQKAEECCKTIQRTADSASLDHKENSSCYPGWNFYHCWPHLQIGESHEAPCLDYVFFDMPKPPCKRVISRTCIGKNKSKITNRCQSMEFHRFPGKDQSPEEVAKPVENEVCCRTEREYDLSFGAYRQDTCARCYNYVLPAVKTGRYWYNSDHGVLMDKENNNASVIAVTNNEAILSSLRGADVKNKWKDCCSQALDCCRTMTEAERYSSEGPFCPRTWDGWQCFTDTPVNGTAYASCPDYIYFSHHVVPQCRGKAKKECVANNTWYQKKNEYNQTREYTDYSACSKPEAQKNQEHFLIACYAVSLAVLIPALIIFCSYRQLRVPRIYMHSNFFLALSLSCIFSIMYRCIVILPEMETNSESKTPVDGNGPGCKLLLILTRYTRMCTYTWMLCEGFYLQRLITCAFMEQKKLIGFYLVGWAFPVLPITVYAIINKTLSDVNCWAIPTVFEWILGSINLACILVNVFFLINIIRVLVTKLKSIQSNEPSHYRKAVRATLVLIPLFGTHFVVVTYNGNGAASSCSAMTFYFYFKDAIDGLQGFGVALIFCYLNGEVLSLLRRSYERFKVSRGLPGNPVRSRWSMSTQLSNAVEQNKGTPPMSNNRAAATVLNNSTNCVSNSSNGLVLKGLPKSTSNSNFNNNNNHVNNYHSDDNISSDEHKTLPESTSNTNDINQYNPGCTMSKVTEKGDSNLHNTQQNTVSNDDKTPETTYDNKGFGFDNVILSKEKITEL